MRLKRVRWRGLWPMWFAVAFATGCLPATQTIIELDADETLRTTASSLSVRIFSDQGVVLDREVPIDDDWTWPTHVPVSPLDGDVNRRFRIEAILTTENDDRIAIRAALGFGKSRQFTVQFTFGEACIGVQCPDGFTCNGGACVSSFRDGEDCGLPEGEGCDPETNCGCPAGMLCRLASIGATCVDPFRCQGDQDCADRESTPLCDYPTGRCVAAEPARCGLPTTGTGDRPEGERCMTHDQCAAGLTCVSNDYGYDQGAGTYALVNVEDSRTSLGFCRRACDPCAGCGEESCLALPTGGGFCAGAGLIEEDGLCGTFSSLELPCVGGTECLMGRCTRFCHPDPGLGQTSDFNAASHSLDCEPDEVCRLGRASIDGNFWQCDIGQLSRIGEVCSPSLGTLCAFPSQCVGTGSIVVNGGFCSLTADGCGTCPAETHCRAFSWGEVCVREHTSPWNAPCIVDLDCEEGLTCILDGDDGTCR